EFRHLAGNVSFIKAIARGFESCFTALTGGLFFRLNQTAESARQLEILENLTFPPLLAVRLVNLPAAGILRQTGRVDFGGLARRQCDAAFGDLESGNQHLS